MAIDWVLIAGILALFAMTVPTPAAWREDIWKYWRFLPCEHPCCGGGPCYACCEPPEGAPHAGEREEPRQFVYVTIPYGCSYPENTHELGEDCPEDCMTGATYVCEYQGHLDGDCCYWEWYDDSPVHCTPNYVSVALCPDGTIVVEIWFARFAEDGVTPTGEEEWYVFISDAVAIGEYCDVDRTGWPVTTPLADCDFTLGPYDCIIAAHFWQGDTTNCQWRAWNLGNFEDPEQEWPWNPGWEEGYEYCQWIEVGAA